jgi:hypothetical protein
MRKGALNGGRYDLLTGILLVLLLFRAYVPVGFMPASGTPFLLELCPAASPVPLPAHAEHHHAGDTHALTHAHFENCPFGSTPGAGPLAHIIAFAPPATIVDQLVLPSDALRLGVRLPRAHQPRGPPFLT